MTTWCWRWRTRCGRGRGEGERGRGEGIHDGPRTTYNTYDHFLKSMGCQKRLAEMRLAHMNLAIRVSESKFDEEAHA